MPEDSPLWRRVFDDVEHRVGGPLASVTSSADFRAATIRIRDARRMVVKPVQAVASFGLHMVGLPSHSEVRRLRGELHEVQRELLAMRREKLELERRPPESP